MNKKGTISKILYGVAVGDALGFPYQFRGRRTRIKQPVLDMGISQSSLGKVEKLGDSDLGLWSDDTSLSLCLAESLAQGYKLKDMAERFIQWLDQGYLSAEDEAFDVGNQSIVAIWELKAILAKEDYTKLSQRIHEAKVTANGNGALMRILPLIIHIYHLELADQYKIVEEVSALTHPHIRSVICCCLYLLVAEKLIDELGLAEAVEQSQSELRNFLATPLFAGKLDREDEQQLFRLLNKDLSRGIIDPDQWDQDDYIRSDGYVVSSLEAALWCLLNSSNYKDTVLQAVNLGDDTDTVAAIAGGLAALHYGYEAIPAEWIAQLKKPELFTRIVGLWDPLSKPTKD